MTCVEEWYTVPFSMGFVNNITQFSKLAWKKALKVGIEKKLQRQLATPGQLVL